MKYVTLLICSIYIAFSSHAQTFNRPIPDELFPYEFGQHQTGFTGYYLTAPFRLGGPGGLPEAIILDENGYVTWYATVNTFSLLDFKYHPAQQLYSYTRSNITAAWYIVLDTNFNPVDSITNVDGVEPDAHEMIFLSNGNYMIGGLKDSVMDLSAYVFNGQQGSVATVVKGFVIQEFDAAHNLVFQWNSNDYIHPTEAYDLYGYNETGFDYCHANAIEEDTDGNLLVSFRHLDAIYKIDHTTGDVIWILGGKSNYFTFSNDSGFSGQHDIRRLSNGNVSLFDNANNAPQPQISRGVEYSLDTVNWVATRQWEYVYNPSFFAMAMGNCQTTAQDHHLTNYGFTYRPHPSFVHTDAADNRIAEVFFTDSVVSYRSFVYDIPFHFERPDISCSRSGNDIMLTAPAGHNRYEWSTGETTQSIIVSNPGTYQVWVSMSNGMLGSLPFTVYNVADDCFVGTETLPDPVPAATVIGLYDLLGRKIAAPTPGQVYLVHYSNGSVQKKLQWYY